MSTRCERLAERSDEQAVRRRHAGFCLPLAEEAELALLGPQQLSWLERLDAERDNLRAALNWAAESGETEVGLRTAGALWRFWQMRSADVEGREHLDRLLTGRSGSPSIRAYAQSRAAGLAYYQGDFDAVHRYVEASLPVHRELGDDWNLSCDLNVLTMTALAEGDADEARGLAEEALEVARRARNPMDEAYAMAHLGVVLGVQGELDDAQRLIEEGVRRARELGNLRSVGAWTKGLGGITLLQGNYPRARELFEQGLAVLRSLDDAWGILGSLSGLALVALEEHDNGSARRLLNENLELLRKSGHHYRAANSLEIAARLAAAEGRDHRAARLYGAASVFRGSMDAGMFECEVWPDPAPQIARLRSALGEDAFAEAWAQGRAMSFDESLDYALAEEAPSRSSPSVAEPLEPVEDQVEPELELGRAVGARRGEVLLGVLDHVGVLLGRDLSQEALGQVDELLLGLERHAHLPEREARDVAVEGVIRVVGHVGREARFPKRSEDRLHPSHPRRAGLRPVASSDCTPSGGARRRRGTRSRSGGSPPSSRRPPAAGRSRSCTASTMPSSRSSLLATWL